MLDYSVGVKIAWKISSYEAANKKSSYIEVDHIMLGILSLDKIQKNIKLQSNIDNESLNYEKEKLYTTLISFNININALRRNLREILPNGISLPSDGIMHRSEDCKKMFDEAACIGNNFLKINHLFITILGWETSFARKLLVSEKVDIEKLKSEILFSLYRNN